MKSFRELAKKEATKVKKEQIKLRNLSKNKKGKKGAKLIVLDRGNSDSEPELDVPKKSSSDNLAKLPTLTDEEYFFFKLVREGDLNGLKDFMLTDMFRNIDINKTDKYGFSALHHAVRRQDEKIVDLILSQKKILTYDTLFHAIQEENVLLVNKILAFQDTNYPLPKPQSPIASENITVVGQQSFNPPGSLNAVTSKGELQTVLTSQINSRKSFEIIEAFDSEFPTFLTHFMLAAQHGNEELMEIFYSKGERLESPEHHHNTGCMCTVCCETKDEYLDRAKERIHLFDAITNPKYICFISGKNKYFDPISYALRKITKCRSLKKVEKFSKSTYKDYQIRLEEFIRDFIGLCRDNKETGILLGVSDKRDTFDTKWHLKVKHPRLWTMVSLKLIDAVAHPHAQTIIYQDWATDDWPEWDTHGLIFKICIFILRTIFLPFIMLYLILFGHTNTPSLRWLTSPVSKFQNWVASYTIFLAVLLVQAILPQRCNNLADRVPYTTKDGQCDEHGMPNVGTEWFIICYVLGLFLSFLTRQGMPGYWRSKWVWCELANIGCFIATFTCWFVAEYTKNDKAHNEPRESWSQYSPEIIADVFFCFSLILSFLRTFELLQMSQLVGPHQIALGRMLFTFMSVAWVNFIVIFAFALGFNAIYVPYHDLKSVDALGHITVQSSPFGSGLHHTFHELFWSFYGMSGADKPEIIHFLTPDYKHNPHPWVSQLAGKFLFGSFHLIGVIMMFNLVTAYFSGEAEKVMENEDNEWKFARTQIYMIYMKDTLLPPPFNLIPTIHTFLRGCRWCQLAIGHDKKGKQARCSIGLLFYIESKEDQIKENLNKKLYRRRILELTNRYKGLLEERTNSGPATNDDVKEIGDELTELKSQFESKLRELEGTTSPSSGGQLSTIQNNTIDPSGTLIYSRKKRIFFRRTSKGQLKPVPLRRLSTPGSGGTSKSNFPSQMPSMAGSTINGGGPLNAQSQLGLSQTNLTTLTASAITSVAKTPVGPVASTPTGASKSVASAIGPALTSTTKRQSPPNAPSQAQSTTGPVGQLKSPPLQSTTTLLSKPSSPPPSASRVQSALIIPSKGSPQQSKVGGVAQTGGTMTKPPQQAQSKGIDPVPPRVPPSPISTISPALPPPPPVGSPTSVPPPRGNQPTPTAFSKTTTPKK